MTIEIKAPTFPESVQDGSIATWHKKPGESVSRDELIVDIETDKVVLEVVAPADGSLSEILKEEGDTVLSNEVIAKFEEGAAGAKSESKDDSSEDKKSEEKAADDSGKTVSSDDGDKLLSPAARKMADENNIDPNSVPGTGKDGRVTKEDVANFVKSGGSKSAQPKSSAAATEAEVPAAPAGDRAEKRVPMTRLRKRIAERLLEASNTTAMLTTFNEVNMQPVMELRKKYKEMFKEKHNTNLGFMSFFTKATCMALQEWPAVNASLDGNDIVYNDFCDISIAVSSPKGLVVPIIRNAESLSFDQIEKEVVRLAVKARDGKLTIEEMTGGTFTLTNGGIFGSMMSTPIINAPQAAILGMHNIVERAVVENGQIVVRPMMYLALSYDHRIIDGRESVSFLVRIKQLLEDPSRLLLGV